MCGAPFNAWPDVRRGVCVRRASVKWTRSRTSMLWPSWPRVWRTPSPTWGTQAAVAAGGSGHLHRNPFAIKRMVPDPTCSVSAQRQATFRTLCSPPNDRNTP